MSKPKPPPPPGSPRKPPPPPGSERRKHERFELIAQLELSHGGEVSLLPVKDISAGGLFIELVPTEMIRVHAHDEVSVFLDLGADASGAPLTLSANAEVVRVDLGGPGRSAGFGLMWKSSDPELFTQLGRILAHLSSR